VAAGAMLLAGLGQQPGGAGCRQQQPGWRVRRCVAGAAAGRGVCGHRHGAQPAAGGGCCAGGWRSRLDNKTPHTACSRATPGHHTHTRTHTLRQLPTTKTHTHARAHTHARTHHGR
jgi:hypothetical protein